jgi:ABC-2 type transport system ATP-binding protein
VASSFPLPSSPTSPPDADLAAGIVLRGLKKSYGPVQAVRGVDLHIDPGETVAILGPNGAGKTTTIDLLLGLARPDAGTVSVFGRTPPTPSGRGSSAGCCRRARSSRS